MQQQDNHEYPFLYQRQTCHQVQPNQATYQKRQKCQPATYLQEVLGGFFMVRSYYPSECHADYFDFERIEALKPAIEACGISTLSQSPMLGFHKQMDNRIKLLEEILSFRMQGVEFDNGDMYVDG